MSYELGTPIEEAREAIQLCMGTTLLAIPFDGLRTLHQKSACPDAINIWSVCGVNFGTLPPKFGWNETRVVHRVETHFGTTTLQKLCSGSEEGSYLRRIDFCITQL